MELGLADNTSGHEPLERELQPQRHGQGQLVKLRETLMSNLKENIANDRRSAGDVTIEMFVEKCLGEMEKDALRKCIVAEIYCEVMSRTVRVYLLCGTRNSPLCPNTHTV
jgi:hypothetical protein